MGNITCQKVGRQQCKKTYKYLDENQKRYIKSKEKYEQMDKALNYFYSHCKRKSNGAVDWDSLADEELDLFEQWNKAKNKAFSAMSRLEDIIDVDYTLYLFMQTNLHSESF